MDYRKTAQEIYDHIGKKENIISAAHCATRLRLVISDNSKADKEYVENIEGVKGVFFAQGQMQIILGTGVVNKVYDDNGHGTHVAGILGGSGQMSGGILSGIAPLCRFVIVKVLDQKGEANVASILAGLKWVEMNHRKYKIRIVNLSAGAGENLEPGKEKMLIEAVEHLWDLGLVVVVSSGNNGPGEGTIAIPGNSRKVITVGAVKTEKAEKGSCSGAGPTKECVVKPDVIAPGYQIISCNSQIHGKKDAYTVKSGSSMATPVVSGAVALLMEKYPRITNVEVKLRLRETCIHLPGAGEQGWGMLNIRDFLKL